MLVVSMLSELSYILLQEKMLIIPACMIAGIAFVGSLLHFHSLLSQLWLTCYETHLILGSSLVLEI